jgi:hypothetical protein
MDNLCFCMDCFNSFYAIKTPVESFYISMITAINMKQLSVLILANRFILYQ